MDTNTAIHMRYAGLVALVALFGWSTGSAVYGAGPDRSAEDGARTIAAPPSADRIEDVNALLNLQTSTLVTLKIENTVAGAVTAVIPINDIPCTLELAPHSVRAGIFTVEAQLADGSYLTVEPGPVRTLRGRVVEIDGSVVAASLANDGLHARIILPNTAPTPSSVFWVEPLALHVAGATPHEYVVYRSEDVIPSGGTCRFLHPPVIGEQTANVSGSAAGSGPFIAELAIDADFEFFQAFGNVEATVAQIEDIINTMNVQYERDVSLTHVITKIIVRTTEPDPYTTNDPVALLFEFRDHWVSMQSTVQRDVAQLFTGKNLLGNTIGIAFLRGICGIFSGYGVVQSNCFGCSSFACKTDLSAHELGHNWGADHCTCNGWTMNPVLTCANRFHDMFTIPDIIGHRNSRTCLNQGDYLLGIMITAPVSTVPVGNVLPFTATADFLFGQNQDITSVTTWSVDRPEAGMIDANGVFTAFDVVGDTCVTVYGSFSSNGVPRTDEKIIMVLDLDAPRTVMGSMPPDGAIDARQPSEPDGTNPAGWQSIDITFNGDTCLTTREDFMIAQAGGGTGAPSIIRLEQAGPRTVRVHLSDIIEAGAWTTVTDTVTGESIRLGYLPGDVDADRTADSFDILALVDAVNGVGVRRPIWSTDMDRSGVTSAVDILRIVDLLNGAAAFEPWNGRQLSP